MRDKHNHYCYTYNRKRVHISREWKGGWHTWCGYYVETWEFDTVDVAQICKHCLKKWQESQAAREAKPLEKGQ